jgi:L-rhamnose isomerase
MRDGLIIRGYEYAREVYAEKGVDVDDAMRKCAAIPISIHCWQGDDIMGCEGEGGGASGGIATTGNYPGRARCADELRADIDQALKLIPGAKKLSLHASYAELNGKKLDRDAYSAEEFSSWIDWAKDRKLGLDFNPTFFSHPYAADGFTLAHTDK